MANALQPFQFARIRAGVPANRPASAPEGELYLNDDYDVLDVMQGGNWRIVGRDWIAIDELIDDDNLNPIAYRFNDFPVDTREIRVVGNIHNNYGGDLVINTNLNENVAANGTKLFYAVAGIASAQNQVSFNITNVSMIEDMYFDLRWITTNSNAIAVVTYTQRNVDVSPLVSFVQPYVFNHIYTLDIITNQRATAKFTLYCKPPAEASP